MQLEGFGFQIFFFKGNIKSKKDPIQLEFATCGFKGVFKSWIFYLFFKKILNMIDFNL